MKNKTWIAAIILMSCPPAYADQISSMVQGADNYDWETCYNTKLSECMKACITSNDRSCSDDCKSMAKDKCISEGLIPSQ